MRTSLRGGLAVLLLTGAALPAHAARHHRHAAPALRGPVRDEAGAGSAHHGRHRHGEAAETASTTVRPGENLYRISLRTHLSVEALAKANGIKPPYALKPGRVLSLPGGEAGGGGTEVASEAPVRAAPGEAAVRSRHGEGFREETPRELRAEKRELDRLVRESSRPTLAVEPRAGRRVHATVNPAPPEVASAEPPSTTPSAGVSPEDLLPPAGSSRRSRRPEAVASLPTGGPRPYAEAFGNAGPASERPVRDRSGRTHEDAAAAAAAAGLRHPLIAMNTPSPALGAGALAAGRGRFVWPVQGEVLTPFGSQASGVRNDGLDLAVSEGDPVHASAAGEVVYAGGAIPGFGNLVLVKHPGGYVTAYGHLQRIDVAMRQAVTQGQVLGEAGSTGAVTRPELHFEIRYTPSPDQSAKPVDPVPMLPARGTTGNG